MGLLPQQSPYNPRHRCPHHRPMHNTCAIALSTSNRYATPPGGGGRRWTWRSRSLRGRTPRHAAGQSCGQSCSLAQRTRYTGAVPRLVNPVQERATKAEAPPLSPMSDLIGCRGKPSHTIYLASYFVATHPPSSDTGRISHRAKKSRQPNRQSDHHRTRHITAF